MRGKEAEGETADRTDPVKQSSEGREPVCRVSLGPPVVLPADNVLIQEGQRVQKQAAVCFPVWVLNLPVYPLVY